MSSRARLTAACRSAMSGSTVGTGGTLPEPEERCKPPSRGSQRARDHDLPASPTVVSTSVASARPTHWMSVRRSNSTGSSRRVERRHLGILGLLLVGGALLRLRWLGEPMRWDEAATFQKYALGSIGHIATTYDR